MREREKALYEVRDRICPHTIAVIDEEREKRDESIRSDCFKEAAQKTEHREHDYLLLIRAKSALGQLESCE